MADETTEQGGQWEWHRLTTPGQLAKEQLEKIDVLWEAAAHVGSACAELWTKGDSLSRAAEDMNHPPEKDEETLYAEGYYDPDPMEIWSRGMCDAPYEGQQYDMAYVRKTLEFFNEIVHGIGKQDLPEVTCVRVLLARVLAIGEASSEEVV
jgi:hypothetical protein